MDIFELMRKTNSHEVLFFEEPSVSLRAIVAIDNTVCGPALASSRIHNYKDEMEALTDALNIAYYNTYRSALLRKNFGGGSIVLYGDPRKVKSEMYFRALGIFLNKLKGEIFLTKGPGVHIPEMNDVKRESNYILGLNTKVIDPSPNSVNASAKGMIWGLKAAVKETLDKGGLDGLTIVVQGVGEIGANLVQALIQEKANIIITDNVYDKIKVIQDKVPNIKVVKPEEIYKIRCDIFCSCAFDDTITEENINQLNCKILTGSVNRIISKPELMDELNAKKIVYIPGYIINGGDIIQYANELSGNDYKKVEEELYDIYITTLSILRLAFNQKKNIADVALEVANKYVSDVAAIKMLK